MNIHVKVILRKKEQKKEKRSKTPTVKILILAEILYSYNSIELNGGRLVYLSMQIRHSIENIKNRMNIVFEKEEQYSNITEKIYSTILPKMLFIYCKYFIH